MKLQIFHVVELANVRGNWALEQVGVEFKASEVGEAEDATVNVSRKFITR